MKFELFKTLYVEALEYDDKEMYIAERGWQEWMESHSPTEALETIWSLAKGTVKENREKCNLSRTAFSVRNNIPIRTLENWDSGVNAPQDYVKMLIDYSLVIEILNKLEEEKMKQVRIELNEFGGSKRKQLEAAVNQAIKELDLADESYYENDDNAIDRFQARLASESVNDTQAVVVTIGEPNIIQHDYADAIYSDEETGEEGGFERVVRHFTVDDLKEANVHILLTFDI